VVLAVKEHFKLYARGCFIVLGDKIGSRQKAKAGEMQQDIPALCRKNRDALAINTVRAIDT